MHIMCLRPSQTRWSDEPLFSVWNAHTAYRSKQHCVTRCIYLDRTRICYASVDSVLISSTNNVNADHWELKDVQSAYRIWCKQMFGLLVATMHTCVWLPLWVFLFTNQNKTVRSDKLFVSISWRDLLVDHTTISNDYTTNSANILSLQMVVVMATMQSLSKDYPCIT